MMWYYIKGLIHCCLIIAIASNIEGGTVNRWGREILGKCTQGTKLKAMYGKMVFKPSLDVQPMTSMKVKVKWDELKFNPNIKGRHGGGVYVAYTMGTRNGPGGYFGVQIHGRGGSFIFSIWDDDRVTRNNGVKDIKKSSRLAWPVDGKYCKRNCQDCGLPSLRHLMRKGFTTGTKCLVQHSSMMPGDQYEVKLKRTTKRTTINTRHYGGFRDIHRTKLGEVDRDVTGALWEVNVRIVNGINKGQNIHIGTIMFEGDGSGMYRLGTFDEMLGCNKCNAIQHKDTRYGLVVEADDGTTRQPIEMYGWTRAHQSTCKKYRISGSKHDRSISFESGPLTDQALPAEGKKKFKIW